MKINLKFQDYKDRDSSLFPEVAKAGFRQGELESIGVLENGMKSGKPSLWINIKMSDGEYSCAEISAEMFEAVAAGLRGARARWGS